MKVLVVDDEGIVLESCRRVLEAEGFAVALSPSVTDAIDRMASDRPALLLVDVKMPVHDGMYLLRQVRACYPDLPVVVMSGYATADTIRTAAELGAARFVAKPFTPDELLAAIRSVRQQRG